MIFIVRELPIYGGVVPCNMQNSLNAAYTALRQEIIDGKHEVVKIFSAQVVYTQNDKWVVIFTCQRGM